MTKIETIEHLKMLFNAIERYSESQRYFEFIREYVLFICTEAKYIPQTIHKLLQEKLITLDEVIQLDFEFRLYNKNDNTADATFIDKSFINKCDFYRKALESAEKDFKDGKKKISKNLPLLDREPTKEDLTFDIEKLHLKIIAELCKEGVSSYSFKDKTLTIGTVAITFGTDTSMFPILKALFKRKGSEYISFDEIAEKEHEEFSKKYGRKMYFACRRINEKIAKETEIKKFLDYSTKQVRFMIN